jgi:hypothetical protein
LSSRCDAKLPLRPGLWLRNLPITACSQGDCTYAAAWFCASALPKNACSSIAWATAPEASSKSSLSKLSRTHKSSPLRTLSSETVPDRALTTSRYQSAARSVVGNEKFANRCCKWNSDNRPSGFQEVGDEFCGSCRILFHNPMS